MKSNFKPVLLLVLIATFVPELLTGSTPLSGFLNPVIFLLLFFGYGIAVLLIREFVVRYNLNWGGVFILGFAYTILNEGLLAKTMTLAGELPIAAFSNYGVLLGINILWTLSIALFHALCSVLFPILVVHTLYPSESERPWVNKKFAIFLAFIILALGTLFFLGSYKGAGTLSQLGVFFLFMFFLTLLAKRYVRTPTPTPSTALLTSKPLWVGLIASLFNFFILGELIASNKLPVAIFLAVYFLEIFFCIYILRKHSWLTPKNLLLFILGCYVLVTFFSLLFAFMSPAVIPERILIGVLALAFLTWGAHKIIKDSKTFNNPGFFF